MGLTHRNNLGGLSPEAQQGIAGDQSTFPAPGRRHMEPASQGLVWDSGGLSGGLILQKQ